MDQVEALSEWTLHKSSDGAHPDGDEQQMLWLINRARQSPTREGRWLAHSREFQVRHGRDFFAVDRQALVHAFAKIRPSPPAAFDRRLYRAAFKHSRSQIARDVQDHLGQQALMSAEGFAYTQTRYNVFSYANNGLNAHAAFNIDWGPGTGSGMQQPPHHRLGIMSVDGGYSNVGIAGLFDANPHNRVGRYVVSQDFARANETALNHYNKFIVGTVWRDNNENDRYDVDEGISGVRVVPSRGAYFAITSAGGGYAIPITDSGQTVVDFRADNIPQTGYTVTTATTSVLLDLKLNRNGKAAIGARSLLTPRVYLAPGAVDPRRFGNKWGNDRHELGFAANFENQSGDLLLSFRSHFVDRTRELGVFVNGRKLGEIGGRVLNKRPTKERFVIPASLLTDSNRLEIRQRFDDEKWGVDQLKIAQADGHTSVLTRGHKLSGPFGWGRGGQGRRAVHRVLLNVAPSDFELHFDAFAVTQRDDLEVLLNGERLTFVAPEPGNRGFASKHVLIAATDLGAKGNILEFRSRKSTHWGVRNLRLVDVSSPGAELVVSKLHRQRYGFGFRGANHRRIIRHRFITSAQDMIVSLRADFVDEFDSATVHVNGRRVGKVSAHDSAEAHRFSIFKSYLIDGINEIEFRRGRRSAKRWSISDVVLRPISSPTLRLMPGVAFAEDGGQLGWHWGNGEHRLVVRSYVDLDAAVDFTLSTKAFNISTSNQVAIFVNGNRVGFLTKASGAVRQSEKFFIHNRLLKSGRNYIEFRNNLPGRAWGVADILLERSSLRPIRLEVGVTDYRRHDGDDGSTHMMAEFLSTGSDLDFSAVGFDIEPSERVDVYINETHVGRLSRSLNDGHSGGEHFFIPMTLQRPGRNEIEFRRQRSHSRWGVGRLTLTPEPGCFRRPCGLNIDGL